MFLMMMYMMQVDILILVDVDVVESVSYLHYSITCCDLFHYSTVLTIYLLNNDMDHSAGFGSGGVVMGPGGMIIGGPGGVIMGPGGMSVGGRGGVVMDSRGTFVEA